VFEVGAMSTEVMVGDADIESTPRIPICNVAMNDASGEKSAIDSPP
jgi:hypothetical protein